MDNVINLNNLNPEQEKRKGASIGVGALGGFILPFLFLGRQGTDITQGKVGVAGPQWWHRARRQLYVCCCGPSLPLIHNLGEVLFYGPRAIGLAWTQLLLVNL